MPISRALLYIHPSGPLVIESSLQVPLAELPQRELFHYQSFVSSVSQSPGKEPTSRSPSGPMAMPVSTAFFYTPLEAPEKKISQ